MSDRVASFASSSATARAAGPIPMVVAAAGWAAAWVVGTMFVAPLVSLALGTESGDDPTVAVLAAASVAMWAVSIGMLVVVSRQWGTNDPVADYALRFRPVDLVGIPLGVLTQVALVPLLYVPLRAIWPDTFDQEAVEQTTRELVDRADGAEMIVLVLVVVVGAPIVEELVYRGLLARSLIGRLTVWPGLVMSAIWFALVHLDPVLYPGLALAGLVFAMCVVATGRIGPAIVTHAAFNAAGLVIAARAG